ncbi:DUF4179 domain-containing protein [Ornithinibacillus halotolerans]|uniref:DUF4179 domain-containing protein n=1 Tax=Ornithinibacillus halotolerans TaxID=1274357 RepID=A0A916W282_9BACI|nr:DUF4179 domain-containing protein [Ornithinibacillus halotolerans]GGA60409.1 hypothetical protein GCM10008025_00540 [Ornithinibacillus halotolerans]
MFNNEEEKLKKYSESLDKAPISELELDAAIMKGFLNAKEEKKVKRSGLKWGLSVAFVAIILLTFITSIRVSPAFASYVSTIPGMEKIVEMISDNKGMMTAIENEYYQEIGASMEKNGLQITIDGAIADEQGIVLFYSWDWEKKTNPNVDKVELQKASGEELDNVSSFYATYYGDSESTNQGMMEFYFQTPYDTNDFLLNFEVSGEEYNIPFSLNELVKTKKVYDVHETVQVEGQKIDVTTVEVYPTRVLVHLEVDSDNTMLLLDFEDIRLVDETGETWGGIANGFTASGGHTDKERIIYLQSNYFHEPEQLYLVFNRIQAIDKEEAYLVIDTEKEVILEQPKGNRLRNLEIDSGTLSLDIHAEREFNGHIYGEVKDADGNILDSNSSFSRTTDEELVNKMGISFEKNLEKYKSPITIELVYYPNWIEGEAKIKLK